MTKSSVFKMMSIAFVAMSIMFVSCSKDDEVVPTNQHPTNNTNNTNTTTGTPGKFNDGSKDIDVDLGFFETNQGFIGLAGKSNGKTIITIYIQKLPSEKTTYGEGNYAGDPTKFLFGGVVIDDVSYASAYKNGASMLTVEPNGDGTYTYTFSDAIVYVDPFKKDTSAKKTISGTLTAKKE